MNNSICNAISKRIIIKFYYGGGIRVAEPHCHGMSQTGKEVLRAYQTGGFSQSGDPVGWKLFEVDKIMNMILTDTTFTSNRHGYNPHDRGMSTIHCNV